MTPTDLPADSTRVELFVRPDTFGTQDQQADIRRRLATLDETDVIEDVDLSTWQSRVRLDSPDTEDEARAIERYRSFERWADRENVSLNPFFETWERHSEILEIDYEELVTPVMCVAVFDGSDVVEVAPRREGGETVTVRECVESLEAAAADERSDDAPELTAD
jgi:hypothetical protein